MDLNTLLLCLCTLVLAGTGRADDTASEGIHYKPCPEGWTQRMGRCNMSMWMQDRVTFEEAYTLCDGHLPVILNREDQDYVEGMVEDERVWLGLIKNEEDEWAWMSPLYPNITLDQTGFSKISRSSRDKCATISSYGGSWDGMSCDDRHRVACVKPAGCDDGWFGVNCTYKCHCYNNGCENQFLFQCPDGCETGWKGKLCNIPQSQSAISVSYYCFKAESNYSVFLLIDTKGYNFSSITALDAQGQPSSECNKQSFQVQGRDEDNLHINIHTDGSTVFQPPCPAMKIEEGPKMHWQFRLQKSSGVMSVYDEDIHLTCDYTSASPLTVSNEKITTDEVTLVTLERKRISVEIYPATYHNLTRIDASNMGAGQTLVLVAAPTKATGQNIRALYPVLCQANSPDGKAVKKLTDENGCGISDLELDRFHLRETENGPLYVTSRFLAFTLPGYSTVEFNCDFRPGTAERCKA